MPAAAPAAPPTPTRVITQANPTRPIPIPTQPVGPVLPGPGTIGGRPGPPIQVPVLPLSPLFQIISYHLPDEGSANFYSIAKQGNYGINQTLGLAVFTRGTQPIDSFRLQFIDPAASAAAAVACQPLAPPAGLIASVDVPYMSTAPEDRLASAFITLKIPPNGASPLKVLSLTSAVPDAVKQRLANGKNTALLRVVPMGAKLNQCFVAPSGTFLATFYDPSKPVPNPFPTTPPPAPSISSSVSIVSYTPKVEPSLQRCDFIVSGPVNDAKFGAIMDAAHVSKALGTHFFLCPDEAQSLYNGLPASTRAFIAFKDFVSYFVSAFNWTAAKFQSIATAIGTPIVGEKYGKIFGEALLGQLPGSPLTGDFNSIIDQGCDYIKQKADAKIKDSAQGGDPSAATKPTNSAVQEVCDEIKNALAAQDRVSDFLVHDSTLDPRNGVVLVTVKYSGVGSLPAGALGGGGQKQVTIQATGFKGANCSGNACGGPPSPLYRGEFSVPDMAVGSMLTVPVVMSDQPYLKSTDFKNGFVDNQRGNIKVDFSATPPVLVWLKQPYPIPANIPPPKPF